MSKKQGKARTGKPQTGKPEPGKPQTGKPEPGKPQTGKPEPGKPQTRALTEAELIAAARKQLQGGVPSAMKRLEELAAQTKNKTVAKRTLDQYKSKSTKKK